MSQLDATLTIYLWPWHLTSNCQVQIVSGNGRLACHGTKGMGVDRMPWCETLRKWVNWMLRWLGYLWPWICKVTLNSGNGKPNCHEMKGTGVDRMPWCEPLMKWVYWALCWLGYFDLDLWPWIFKIKLYLGNGRLACHETNGTGVNKMPWCKALRKRCADWVALTLNSDLELSRSTCNSGMGGLIVMERKGRESIARPDVKHNHYVEVQDNVRGRGDLRCRQRKEHNGMNLKWNALPSG